MMRRIVLVAMVAALGILGLAGVAAAERGPIIIMESTRIAR